MEETLHQLGGILLRAVPTFIIVVLLHFYLKFVFFKPLQQVLRQRYEATEGARKLAEASLLNASEKAAQYEAALRSARDLRRRRQIRGRRSVAGRLALAARPCDQRRHLAVHAGQAGVVVPQETR